MLNNPGFYPQPLTKITIYQFIAKRLLLPKQTNTMTIVFTYCFMLVCYLGKLFNMGVYPRGNSRASLPAQGKFRL
jgi:hypothetical protein